ncbi:hypothetical protein ERC79_19635 [Rhodococcus sp. ABRD24]|uniref:mycothiol-dependent nitroreductase Rv2466c family protein n=1 Tax=Rhodococcus sp. ABRD24 TaxID=2507582 RepID=UPI00103B048B|nr:DsbA family protein [Rhodococcus sp. ABRD24]QBJ98835.1 hypothetical protein ERC79_19635 [Rhodococcus sp. ABRD24]
MTSVDFHFDPMCPFAFHTSRWIRHVRAETGIDIAWRFFSLEEINRRDDQKHPWERDWSYGWSLMRIGALLRRESMDLLDRWYAATGHLLHVEGGKPHDPEVARELLVQLGLDASLLDAALADPSTHDEVRADHDRVTTAGGFGVPTLFVQGTALFGPVLVDPPQGAAAVRLWNLVTEMLEFPRVYEIQRVKGPADTAAIGEALTPYVQGRDWQSINRGEVVDLSRLESEQEA